MLLCGGKSLSVSSLTFISVYDAAVWRFGGSNAASQYRRLYEE